MKKFDRRIVGSAKTLDGDVTSKAWSPLPMQFANALRERVKKFGDASEPSWNVLAGLIAEEQFIETANYLMVSTNAVEYSKRELVDQLMPLVKEHRYAPYIESFAIDRHRHPEEMTKIAGQMHLVDPRSNMYPLMSHFWSANDASNTPYTDFNTDALWQRDYTLPAMIASLRRVDDSWWQMPSLLPSFQRYIVDLQAISPYAPNTLRLEIMTTVDPNAEQLARWEGRAKSDPLALFKIASLDKDRSEIASAIRCFEKSYALCPSYDTAVGLASAYRSAGQEDKWLPALEDYLQQEDYALGHAQVHDVIADDYIAKGKWADAEPHALASAQTWSAWGLVRAGQVYEGLGRWDESEKWLRAAAESYPSHSGYEWYLWCRRTGRGNVAEARKYFAKFLQVDWVQKAERRENFLFVDDMLDGRYEQALDRIQSNPEYANDTYWQTQVTLLAKRLGKDKLYAESMDRLMLLTDEQFRDSDPNFHAVIAAMQRLQRQGSLDDASIADVDRRLEKFAAWARCNYCYFLGEQLALHGHQDRAEAYWRRALAGGQNQKYNGTFAGQRLVEKFGTSRPDEVSAAKAIGEPAKTAE